MMYMFTGRWRIWQWHTYPIMHLAPLASYLIMLAIAGTTTAAFSNRHPQATHSYGQ
jgi:hypothetical protein